jgi:anti-sigma factor RsiW
LRIEVPFFSPRRRAEAPDDEPIELAAVADGSLSPDERAAAEARLGESPELAARLAEQERALALVRQATAATDAPAGLRGRIDAERRGRGRRARPRLALATGVSTAVAVALVLFLVLPGGAGGPSLASAAALSARPATDPAPPSQPGEPKLLDREVGGVPFPSWRKKFGWRTTGERADSLGGRDTATVFYAKKGKRVGYTIVDGKPLKVPAGAAPARRNGIELKTFRTDGRLAVTWLRNGRTCILVASGVPRNTLLKLAAWKGKGAVQF